MQLLTIFELIKGAHIEMPPQHATERTFKKAPKAKTKKRRSRKLPFQGDSEY
jgi:hypothetical protein